MARKKAWEGRLEGKQDPVFETFNSSLAVDRVLLLDELEQNRAWSRALNSAGIYSVAELARVHRALDRMQKEAERGEFTFAPTDEDVHMGVERRLTELVGAAGEKLQTGRSRNDQVGTSVRMFLRREGARVVESLHATMKALVERASEEMETPMPGLTHVQPAQVISLGHYLMSAFWALERDLERLRAALRRSDRMPLGSGALAGSTLPLDRIRLARELKFTRITENSLDAVQDRDFIAEVSFVIAQMLVHISRFAEDWIQWSSPQYGWLDLPDNLSTGSSLMPQKKNPDSLELIRGKSARAVAQVMGILTLQKGLPTSYNKDLQEDKEGLFDTLDTAWYTLEVFCRVVSTCRFNREKMVNSLTDDLYATDLADYLVKKGLPFRQAHEVVGRLTRRALDSNTPLSRLPLSAFRQASPLFESDVTVIFSPYASLAVRSLAGGTGPDSVAAQVRAARTILGLVPGTTHDRARLSEPGKARAKAAPEQAPALRPTRSKATLEKAMAKPTRSKATLGKAQALRPKPTRSKRAPK